MLSTYFSKRTSIYNGVILITLIFMLLFPSGSVHAATFSVATYAELVTAINTANANGQADTITLTDNITLTATLPSITSEITIEGANHTLNGNDSYRVLSVTSTGNLTINQLNIVNGYVTDLNGGGINNLGTLYVNYSTFSNNSANRTSSNGRGGAIYSNGTLNVNNSTFIGNSADNSGGGIHFHTIGSSFISNSTFVNNSADFGGGLLNYGSTVTISNSTFSENSAITDGGGLRNNGTMTIVNSTISGNSADIGGGFYNIGTLSIVNIISANSTTGGDCVSSGTIISNISNLIEDGSCSATYSGDPRLNPLADNGGPTLTYALQPSSPAIDMGNNPACPAMDQRGTYRPQGAGCDIGAFELVQLTIEKYVDNLYPAPGQTLTYNIQVTVGTTVTNGIISDTLPAGLNFLGPITLEPPFSGTVGSAPPLLITELALNPGEQVTVTLPVTVSYGLAAGTIITNTAAVTSAEVSNPSIASVAVTIINLAPEAEDDQGVAFTTDEKTPFTTGDVLSNDWDANGDFLSVDSFDTNTLSGTLSYNGNGTFNYNPNSQFIYLAEGVPASDTFSYVVSDSVLTDTATVDITVVGVNDPPQGDTLTIFLAETEADSGTIPAIDPDIGDTLTYGILVDPIYGITSLDPQSGWNVYTATNYSMSYIDSVTFVITDTGNLTTTTTITYVVSADNDPPVAVDDWGSEYTTDEENAFTTGNVLDNDFDPDLDGVISLDSFDTSTLSGTLTSNGNGTFNYDPNGVFEYLAVGEQADDIFSYVISDGTLTDTATVTITVEGVNGSPVAVDDEGAEYTTNEVTIFTTGNVLDNDYDPDFSDLLFVDSYDDSLLLGTLTNNGDGTFGYDPNGMFDYLAPGEQAQDIFSYAVSDGLLTDTAFVTITINGINSAPIAVDDSGPAYTTNEENPFSTGNVLDNDTEPEGDLLTLDSYDDTSLLGLLTSNGDGTFEYDPNGMFNYLASGEHADDVFTYVATDSVLTDTATVTITVEGVNDPPVALDDAGLDYTTNEDMPFTTGNVLDNDLDPDISDVLTVESYDDSGLLGMLSNNGDGTFDYDPNGIFNDLLPGEQAQDVFTYVVSDGVLTDTAIVTITVIGINQNPVVDVGPDQIVEEGELVEFLGSFIDPGLLVMPTAGESIKWDFGDGNLVTGTLTTTHTYVDNGTFTATLTVTDTLGGVGKDWLTVTVENVAPVLGAFPDQEGYVGEIITVTGTITDPGLLDTQTVMISWGDGTITNLDLGAGQQQFSTTHNYSTANDYPVDVLVTDKDGGNDELSFIARIRDRFSSVYLPLVTR